MLQYFLYNSYTCVYIPILVPNYYINVLYIFYCNIVTFSFICLIFNYLQRYNNLLQCCYNRRIVT